MRISTIAQSLIGLFTSLQAQVAKFFVLCLKLFYPSASGSPSQDKILVIRLDHKLGDMVCFSDFIHQLRLMKPGAEITLIAHKGAKSIYGSCPYINNLVLFDWGKSLPLSLFTRVSRSLIFILKNNLHKNWNLAICSRFDEDFHAPFLACFSGARKRIGYASNTTPKKARLLRGTDSLYTAIMPGCGVRHEVDRNLDLLKFAIGVGDSPQSSKLEVWPTVSDINSAESKLDSKGIQSSDGLLAIGFGAYEEKRTWPIESFAELILRIKSSSQFSGYRIALLGSASERIQGEEIIRRCGEGMAVNFAGATNIGECTTILRRSTIFIGNDSGLLHLAAASGCACIELSCHPLDGDPAHSNSPIRFGPFTPNSIMLQPFSAIPPCTGFCQATSAHCLASIQVDRVVAALTELHSSTVTNRRK